MIATRMRRNLHRDFGFAAIMAFDHGLETLQAGTALRLIAIRACAVNIGYSRFAIGFGELFFNFFVAEWVAKADIHSH